MPPCVVLAAPGPVNDFDPFEGQGRVAKFPANGHPWLSLNDTTPGSWPGGKLVGNVPAGSNVSASSTSCAFGSKGQFVPDGVMLVAIVHTSSLGAQFPFAETSAQHVAVASGVPAHDAGAVAGGTEKDVTVGIAPPFTRVLLCGVIAEKTSTAPGVVLKSKFCVVPG